MQRRLHLCSQSTYWEACSFKSGSDLTRAAHGVRIYCDASPQQQQLIRRAGGGKVAAAWPSSTQAACSAASALSFTGARLYASICTAALCPPGQKPESRPAMAAMHEEEVPEAVECGEETVRRSSGTLKAGLRACRHDPPPPAAALAPLLQPTAAPRRACSSAAGATPPGSAASSAKR